MLHTEILHFRLLLFLEDCESIHFITDLFQWTFFLSLFAFIFAIFRLLFVESYFWLFSYYLFLLLSVLRIYFYFHSKIGYENIDWCKPNKKQWSMRTKLATFLFVGIYYHYQQQQQSPPTTSPYNNNYHHSNIQQKIYVSTNPFIQTVVRKR